MLSCRCGCGKIPVNGRDYYYNHRSRNKTGLHFCRSCQKEKPEADFYLVSYYKGRPARYWKCRSCVSIEHKQKRQSWGPQQKLRNQRYQLKFRLKKFGLTPEDYDRILSEQDGKCAICFGGNGESLFNLDHCHATGKVRGLLCDECNWALGHFDDDIPRIQTAIRYLEKWSS